VIVCSNRIVHQRFATFDLTRAVHAGAKRLHERPASRAAALCRRRASRGWALRFKSLVIDTYLVFG